MSSPNLVVSDAKATALGGGFFRVSATVTNDGLLPTNITERALKAKLAQAVRARLRLKNADLADGKAVIDLGNIPGTRALRGAGFSGGGAPGVNRHEVSWVVKAKGPDASADLEIASEKGGTERRTLALK